MGQLTIVLLIGSVYLYGTISPKDKCWRYSNGQSHGRQPYCSRAVVMVLVRGWSLGRGLAPSPYYHNSFVCPHPTPHFYSQSR